MNIKSTLHFIRGILYVREIMRCQSINRAAEENNIQTANLSTILNDLEKQLGIKLFKRSPTGCTPTTYGRQVADYATAFENILQKIKSWETDLSHAAQTINIYISPTMKLEGFWEFETSHPDLKLRFVEDEILADIKITNQPPKNLKKTYTELHIGENLKQKVWICCDDTNSTAMMFFDFIVARLLLLYGQ